MNNMKTANENTIEQLREICTVRAREIYGRLLPPRIENEIEGELKLAEQAGVADEFLETHRMLQLPCFQKDDYLNIGLKGALGSSFLAYLCGFTTINPGEIDNPYALYSRFYYEKPEKRFGQRSYVICLEFGQDTEQDFIRNHGADALPQGVMICSTKELTLLERLQRKTGSVRYVEAGMIPEELFARESCHLGCASGGLYHCVEDVYETILNPPRRIKPDLAAIMKELMLEFKEDGEHVTMEVDDEVLEVYQPDEPEPISCEEALPMALRAGTGKLEPSDYARVREAGMDDEIIAGLKAVLRLPFRAECIAKSMEAARLDWYRNRYPGEYYKLRDQIY